MSSWGQGNSGSGWSNNNNNNSAFGSNSNNWSSNSGFGNSGGFGSGGFGNSNSNNATNQTQAFGGGGSSFGSTMAPASNQNTFSFGNNQQTTMTTSANAEDEFQAIQTGDNDSFEFSFGDKDDVWTKEDNLTWSPSKDKHSTSDKKEDEINPLLASLEEETKQPSLGQTQPAKKKTKTHMITHKKLIPTEYIAQMTSSPSHTPFLKTHTRAFAPSHEEVKKGRKRQEKRKTRPVPPH